MVEINDPFVIGLLAILGGIIGSFGTYIIVYRFEHNKQRLEIKEIISDAIQGLLIHRLSQIFEWYLMSLRDDKSMEKYNEINDEGNQFFTKTLSLLSLYIKKTSDLEELSTLTRNTTVKLNEWLDKNKFENTIPNENYEEICETIENIKSEMHIKLRSTNLII